MNTKKYLLRLDDLHPRMRIDRFVEFMNLVSRFRIKPILGVIPNNQDESLNHAPFDSLFFQTLRLYQASGYAIALHGYEHRYLTTESGFLGINPYSEFAGLSYDDQLARLVKGIAILESEGIYADMFMAPAHSFDDTTLKALKQCGLLTITDGFYMYPRTVGGIQYLPQQVWRLRRIPLPGKYTFCLHLDGMSNSEFRSWMHGAERFFEMNCESFDDPLSIDYLKYNGVLARSCNWLFWNLYILLKRLRMRNRRFHSD